MCVCVCVCVVARQVLTAASMKMAVCWCVPQKFTDVSEMPAAASTLYSIYKHTELQVGPTNTKISPILGAERLS
jgi:hypothetical protein